MHLLLLIAVNAAFLSSVCEAAPAPQANEIEEVHELLQLNDTIWDNALDCFENLAVLFYNKDQDSILQECETANKMIPSITAPSTIMFAKVDARQDSAVANNVGVGTFPTVVFFKKSKLINFFTEWQSAEDILEWLKDSKSLHDKSQDEKATSPAKSQDGKATAPAKSQDGKATAPAKSQDGKATAPAKSQEGKAAQPQKDKKKGCFAFFRGF